MKLGEVALMPLQVVAPVPMAALCTVAGLPGVPVRGVDG